MPWGYGVRRAARGDAQNPPYRAGRGTRPAGTPYWKKTTMPPCHGDTGFGAPPRGDAQNPPYHAGRGTRTAGTPHWKKTTMPPCRGDTGFGAPLEATLKTHHTVRGGEPELRGPLIGKRQQYHHHAVGIRGSRAARGDAQNPPYHAGRGTPWRERQQLSTTPWG